MEAAMQRPLRLCGAPAPTTGEGAQCRRELNSLPDVENYVDNVTYS